jgi:CBS domain-containing membrane protein
VGKSAAGLKDGLRLVRDLMRREFVTMVPEENLLDAERIMRLARIRHMPIVEGELLVGILSHRDVVEASIPDWSGEKPAEREQHLRDIAVSEVMREKPWTAYPDTTLREAAERMLRFKIGCLPVVEQGSDGLHLVGLVTESDLLRAAYAPDFTDASD